MNHDRSPNTYKKNVPRRVLIVDDNPKVLQDLRLFLECTGEVQVVGKATNGEEAVRLALELLPDTVVMDLEMPVMNGIEATRLIKSHISTLRVVMLSIHRESAEQEKACLAGVDSFIIKGDSYEELLNAILGKSASHDSVMKGI
jgi:DNA-binding NarL/FixJ family response regulator